MHAWSCPHKSASAAGGVSNCCEPTRDELEALNGAHPRRHGSSRYPSHAPYEVEAWQISTSFTASKPRKKYNLLCLVVKYFVLHILIWWRLDLWSSDFPEPSRSANTCTSLPGCRAFTVCTKYFVSLTYPRVGRGSRAQALGGMAEAGEGGVGPHVRSRYVGMCVSCWGHIAPFHLGQFFPTTRL